jgi:hypothetical protein
MSKLNEMVLSGGSEMPLASPQKDMLLRFGVTGTDRIARGLSNIAVAMASKFDRDHGHGEPGIGFYKSSSIVRE